MSVGNNQSIQLGSICTVFTKKAVVEAIYAPVIMPICFEIQSLLLGSKVLFAFNIFKSVLTFNNNINPNTAKTKIFESPYKNLYYRGNNNIKIEVTNPIYTGHVSIAFGVYEFIKRL